MYKVMLADEMSSYIANFVKTGNPNGEGLAEWETCTEENSGSLCGGMKENLRAQ